MLITSIIIIMKANSAGKRVVIGGGHARKEGRWKSGNERGCTIPCEGNNIDVRNVETGFYQHLYYSLYTFTHLSIYTTQYMYTYIYFISLLNAPILYVLYLPVKPKPISPMYTHMFTSSSIQP